MKVKRHIHEFLFKCFFFFIKVNDLGGDFHGEGKSRQADKVVAEIKAAGGEGKMKTLPFIHPYTYLFALTNLVCYL